MVMLDYGSCQIPILIFLWRPMDGWLLRQPLFFRPAFSCPAIYSWFCTAWSAAGLRRPNKTTALLRAGGRTSLSRQWASRRWCGLL